MPRRAPMHRPNNAGDREVQQRQAKAVCDRRRPSAAKRGYGSDWRALRLAHLQGEPICRMCKAEGRVTVADCVDHIVPIAMDEARRLDPTNLQSLCASHHSAKTAREDGRWGRRDK